MMTTHACTCRAQWSPAIAFITCFVTLFATVIAITKVRQAEYTHRLARRSDGSSAN